MSSIYLHCDPSSSHYLKIMMDYVFGIKNFRNEIVWNYKRWTAGDRNFQKMHDLIFRYSKDSSAYIFNMQYEPYGESTLKNYRHIDEETGKKYRWQYLDGKKYKLFLNENKGVKMSDVWDIQYLAANSKERTGYPTQKPLALFERIIKASSNGEILDKEKKK